MTGRKKPGMAFWATVVVVAVLMHAHAAGTRRQSWGSVGDPAKTGEEVGRRSRQEADFR
jgi:hypothetical protein